MGMKESLNVYGHIIWDHEKADMYDIKLMV